MALDLWRRAYAARRLGFPLGRGTSLAGLRSEVSFVAEDGPLPGNSGLAPARAWTTGEGCRALGGQGMHGSISAGTFTLPHFRIACQYACGLLPSLSLSLSLVVVDCRCMLSSLVVVDRRHMSSIVVDRRRMSLLFVVGCRWCR